MLVEGDSNRSFRFILALIAAILITIIVAFNSGFLNFIDSTLVDVIQGEKTGLKDGIYTFISMIASPKMDIIWTALLAFLLWGFKYKIPALWALFTLIVADVIGEVIKVVIQRPRPPMHLASDKGYSFPSGHVVGTTVVLALIWILVVPLIKRHVWQVVVRILCGVGLILVMLSRVYLNAHYPTDTLGALIITYAWLQVAEWFYPQFVKRLLKLKLVKNTKY